MVCRLHFVGGGVQRIIGRRYRIAFVVFVVLGLTFAGENFVVKISSEARVDAHLHTVAVNINRSDLSEDAGSKL